MNLVTRNYLMNDFFEDVFNDKTLTHQNKCDIYEKDNKYFIEIDVPGFEKSDISIIEEDGYLKISGEKSNEVNEEDKNYIRRERVSSNFSRSFYVGNIDYNHVIATFENGILNIEVPKETKEDKKNTIEIK